MEKDFVLADIFSNHMVFQHGKPIYVFGKCKENILVEVRILNKYYTFMTEGSEFCFKLENLPVIKIPFDVTLKSNEQIEKIEDCLVGDVYLMTGQSNMQYVCKDVKNIDYMEVENLRLYEVPKLPYKGAELEFDWLYCNNPAWKYATEPNEREFSAISYMLGKDIVLKHDVPVGLISCNMGDSTVYSWIEKSVILNNSKLKGYDDDYLKWQEKYGSFKKFDEYFKKQVPILINFYDLVNKFKNEGFSFDKSFEKAREVYPNPYLPMGPKNQNRPSGCFDTLLKEIIPFASKAIVYYQGENDVCRPEEYKVAIQELINNWRELFHDKLPFIIIQLAGHVYSDISGLNVAQLRDSQASIIDFDKKNYLATALDYGEENNIHPVNKKEVAKRVFMLVDEFIYKANENSHSPILKSYKFINDDTILIDVKLNSNPLHLKNMNDYGFYGVNQTDELVKITKITVIGSQIIIKGIKDLKEIRYAYDAFPKVSVFTSNSLPLLPFRIVMK